MKMNSIARKLLALCMTVLMLVSMAVPAFASELEGAQPPEGEGQQSIEQQIIPAQDTEPEHVHSHQAAVTTPASCTAEGVMTYTCACGDTYTAAIPLAEHTYGEASNVAPGCETEGSVSAACTVCGFVNTQVVPAAGHSYGEATTVAPTCEAEGSVSASCTVCGFVNTEVIPAAGHSYGEPVVVAATCTADGSKAYTCAVCGNVYTEVIPAAHTYAEAVVTPSTCTADGSWVYTCTVEGCGNVYTETIPAAHTYGEAVVVEPTCTAEGSRTYTCTVEGCGNVYTEIIPAAGHSYVDMVCSVCGAVQCSWQPDCIAAEHYAECIKGNVDKATVLFDALLSELAFTETISYELRNSVIDRMYIICELDANHRQAWSSTGEYAVYQTAVWDVITAKLNQLVSELPAADTVNAENFDAVKTQMDKIKLIEEAYRQVWYMTEREPELYQLLNSNANYVELTDIISRGVMMLATNPVAKVGEEEYDNLQVAINAAASGGTVVLWDNIELTEGVTIPAGAAVTLDLNGKSITGTPAAASAYAVINNNGSLTINATGGGAIVCNHTLAGSTAYAVNTITNCGALTINGGTIQNTSTASNQIGYAIDNNSTVRNAVLTVNGGSITVSGSSYYDGIRQFCNSESNENSVTIAGGSVSTIWLQNPSDGSGKNANDVKGSVSISNGSVSKIYLEPSAAFHASISGGSIGSVAYNEPDTNNAARNLTAFITGGTFTSADSVDPDMLKTGYTLEANGDGTAFSPVPPNPVASVTSGETTTEYTDLSKAFAEAPSGSTITLLDNIELTEGVTVPAGASVTLDLNGKLLSGNATAAGASAVITNNGTLTIKDSGTGGKITCFAQNPDTAAIPFYANNTITNCGTLNLLGGTIENSTQNGLACFPIDNNSTVRDAIVNIQGGTVTGRGAIRQFANSTAYRNEVNITGGTVYGTSYGVWVQNPSDGGGTSNNNETKAKLTISSGSVSKVLLEPSSALEVSITGGSISDVAIWETDTTNPARNPSGFISGGTFANGNIDESLLADGYSLVDNGNSGYSPVLHSEARIGNELYTSFAEALEDAAENSTIVLMKDVVCVDNLVIERNINIDPNGHSFTLAEGKVISVAEGKVLTINLDYDTDGAAFKALAPGLCVSEGSIKIQHHAVGTSGSAATCTSGPICGFCGEEFGASLGHALVYTGSGSTITETCGNGCVHSATAKLELDSSVSTVYTGSEIKALKVTYSENWMAEKDLTVSYKDNIAIGKATGTIEKLNEDNSKATATAQFDITRATYSLTVNNYRYIRGSGYPLSFTSNVPYSADNTVTKLLIYRANGTPVMEVPAAHFVLSANSSGMTVITLSPTVMNALDALNYELYASFTNGDAKGAFRVLLPLIFPMTGDDAQTLLLLCLTFVALGTAGVTLFVIRRKSKGNRYNGRH